MDVSDEIDSYHYSLPYGRPRKPNSETKSLTLDLERTLNRGRGSIESETEVDLAALCRRDTTREEHNITRSNRSSLSGDEGGDHDRPGRGRSRNSGSERERAFGETMFVPLRGGDNDNNSSFTTQKRRTLVRADSADNLLNARSSAKHNKRSSTPPSVPSPPIQSFFGSPNPSMTAVPLAASDFFPGRVTDCSGGEGPSKSLFGGTDVIWEADLEGRLEKLKTEGDGRPSSEAGAHSSDEEDICAAGIVMTPRTQHAAQLAALHT
ncbi:hypothetical protein HK102_005986, partial [Quaeritorhiza haematococci]